MPTQSPWLTREEAADYSKITGKTLANMAAEDPPKGPPFWNPNGGVRGGRVRYHRALLDRWLAGDRRYQGLQKRVEVLEETGLVPRIVISDHADKIVRISESDVVMVAYCLEIDRHVERTMRQVEKPSLRSIRRAKAKEDMAWFDARLPDVAAMLALPPLMAAE